MMFQQDGRPETGVNANLKKHLSSKTVEELKKELDTIFEKEERTGEPADPTLVAAYCSAMEAMTEDQPTRTPNEFEASWATFTKNHPDLFPKEKTRSRDRGRQLRRGIELVILAATVLVLSAAAFQWPDHMVTWGKELLHITPAEPSCGVMALPEPNADGYSTLAEAVADLGTGEAKAPAWIPEGFTINTIVVQQSATYNVAIAKYVADNLEIMIRTTYYFNQKNMPDWVYEKNDGKRVTYTYNQIDHFFIENFDRLQAIWKNGNYLYSISGNVTREEMERMVNSIYGG